MPRPETGALPGLEVELTCRAEDELLHFRVEIRRDPSENVVRHPAPESVDVEMVVDGLLPRAGRLEHFGGQLVHGEMLPRLPESLRLSNGLLHVGEGALEAAERLPKEADPLVERDELPPEAVRRPEVDDLDRARPADPVEPPDPLLHRGRIGREVEKNEPPAELEVAPFAPRLGRDEERRTSLAPELRHLEVSAPGRQLLVKDGDAPPRPGLETRLESLNRRQIVDEDERLSGERRLREPRHARVGEVGLLVAREPRLQGRRREIDGDGSARREPPEIGAARCARHGGERPPFGERCRELQKGAVRVGAKEGEEVEEAGDVGLERRGGQKKDVPRPLRERRDRAPRVVSPRARRPLQPVRLVHDEEIEARAPGALGEVPLLRQLLERDDEVPMGFERIESGAVFLRHVLAPLPVEEDEGLVELPPELAQPLDRQARRRHHESPLGTPRPDEARQDETRLDGLSEPHLVREEPSDRIGGRRAFGHVKLVREDPDPPAEKRAEAPRLPDPFEKEAVQPVHERRHAVHVERGEALQRGARRLEGPDLRERNPPPVRKDGHPLLKRREDRRLAAEAGRHPLARRENDGAERRIGRRERQKDPGLRKADDEKPAGDLLDAPRPEVGIEAVEERVPRPERPHQERA